MSNLFFNENYCLKLRHAGSCLTELLDDSIPLSAGVNMSHIIKHKHFISSLSGEFSSSERNTGANNSKLRSNWVLPIEGKHVIIHVQSLEAVKNLEDGEKKSRISKKERACDGQKRGPHDFTVQIYPHTLH